MLEVSERALHVLEMALHSNSENDGEVLRIDDVDGDVALTVDSEQPGDQLVSRDERPVLAIAGTLAAALDGMVLDVDGVEQGIRLVFREAA